MFKTFEAYEKLTKAGKQADMDSIAAHYGSANDIQHAFVEVVDAMSTNPVWFSEFKNELKRQFPNSGNYIDKNLRVFNDDEKKVMFDSFGMKEEEIQKYTIESGSTTSPNIGNLLNTTIFPVVDGLIRDDSSILSEVQMRYVDSMTNAIRVNEFDAESLAVGLGETAGGTAVDDGNRLIKQSMAPIKIQASTSVSELTLLNVDPATYAQIISKLVRRVQNEAVRQIFRANASSTQMTGIIPTTGTGIDRLGALTVAGSGDLLDSMLTLLKSMPDTIVNEVGQLKYYMTFSMHVALMSVTSANAYKAMGANYQALSAGSTPSEKNLFGVPVKLTNSGLQSTSNPLTQAYVLLGNMRNYVMVMKRGVVLKSDEGKVQLREGVTNFVANMYANGTPTLAFNYTNDTAGTTASTANTPNNQARNAWRTQIYTHTV